MIKEERIVEIKRQLKKGVPEGELRNNLIDEGFTQEEIKEIFKPHKYDMRSWLLVSAILVLLFSLYSSMYGGIKLLPFILSGLLFYEYHKAKKKFEAEG